MVNTTENRQSYKYIFNFNNLSKNNNTIQIYEISNRHGYIDLVIALSTLSTNKKLWRHNLKLYEVSNTDYINNLFESLFSKTTEYNTIINYSFEVLYDQCSYA